MVAFFHLWYPSVEYKPDMSVDDPKALFQQKIPASFLNLQYAIREKVAADKQRSVKSSAKAIPIMDEKTFKSVVVKRKSTMSCSLSRVH